MSIAEFYTENCIDPDWYAPNGMDNFLRAHASESSDNNRRKRGRDECHEAGQGFSLSSDPTEHEVVPRCVAFPHASASGGGGAAKTSSRPAKRAKRDMELVQFDAPFPCAFFLRQGHHGSYNYNNNIGCRFRSTCSYHHGVALPCDCDSPSCPRGHAHRRAPRSCDHGSTCECRWNVLGECSFHHGIAEMCQCELTSCPRAHPRRVRKNAEARLDRSRELAQRRPDFADRNARTLFLGSPTDKALCTESYIHEKFSYWISTASLVKLDGDPIIGVRVDPEYRFAFIEFHQAEMATVCLSVLDTLLLNGWGKVKLERPNVYNPSRELRSNPNSVVSLAVERLDHLRMERSNAVKPNKKEKANIMSKKTKLYRTWRREQKALKTGETGQQLRQRYLQCFPERK